MNSKKIKQLEKGRARERREREEERVIGEEKKGRKGMRDGKEEGVGKGE